MPRMFKNLLDKIHLVNHLLMNQIHIGVTIVRYSAPSQADLITLAILPGVIPMKITKYPSKHFPKLFLIPSNNNQDTARIFCDIAN